MIKPSYQNISQKKSISQTEIKVPKFFFALIGFLGLATLATVCFYAYLIPLHVDEAGYWFNFTSRAIENRDIPNYQIPNHTLTIYGAKLSLNLLGYNGIGYRFPVIFFSFLSVGAMFMLAQRFLKSKFKASLAVGLLFLCPWYLHHSHELRGYPSYIFFALIAFIVMDRILKEGDRPVLWVLMLGAFIGCYYSSMGSVVFIFNFMVTLWFLKICQCFRPQSQRLASFQAISISSFVIFSVIATAIMSFIMFKLDLTFMLENRQKQIIHGNGLWDWTWVFKLATDIFSTFLGYRYLDDPTSILYNYPLPVWMFSLVCFFYGLKLALDSRKTPALIFVTLYTITILFNFATQHYINTRAVCYLLPFLLILQAEGLVELIKTAIKRIRFSVKGEEAVYGIVTVVLIFYFSIFSIGKYRNFDPDSGNPYELARIYLENNTGPNDLIISSLNDSLGGFYLGDMIREKNFNIYNNGRIEDIFYLTPKPGESKIELDMTFPVTKKVKFLPLDKFKPVVSFENKGVRPSEVHIFKNKVEMNPLIRINETMLSVPEYFGNFKKVCKTKIDGQGVRISCDESPFTCAKQVLNFHGVTKNDTQLIFLHHINDKGTKTDSYASLRSMPPSAKAIKEKLPFRPIPEIYLFNKFVNNIFDMDLYRKSVDLIDVSLQKMGGSKNILFCMGGRLFEGNSLIKGVKVFNWKQETPEVN